MSVMATTTRREAARLAGELTRHFGSEPITATALAEELVDGDRAAELIAAIEDALERAAAAGDTDRVDEALWGPPPSDEAVADARRLGQEAVEAALGAALADALNREQAARRLGITPQAVSKRLASGSLLALSRGRERWFPAWQFHEDGVLPGLADLIAAYPGTPLALTAWATSPCADLDGRAPAEVLTRRGGTARVVEAAEALTAAAW